MFDGLSISDEWAGNVNGTIADLTGTLEFHEAQLNIVLGKPNNLQTRMNTVMPRTKKMDKEFSQLDSKLESYKRKSQANELLTKRNRELILAMDERLTQLEGIVSEQDPCRCKPPVTADKDLNSNYYVEDSNFSFNPLGTSTPIGICTLLQNSAATQLEDTTMEVKEEKVPTSLVKNKNDRVFEEKTNPNRQSPYNRSKPVFRFTDSSLTNNYAASSNTPNPFAFKQTSFVSQFNISNQAGPSSANTSHVRNPPISDIKLLKLY